MVRVRRCMDRGDALAIANEIEQRRAPCRRRGLVCRVVEEASRRAIEEQDVVLLQVLGADVDRVVANRRRPGSKLLPHLVDRRCRERDRRMNEPRRMTVHENFVWLCRFCGRRRRERCLHLLDVGGAGNLRIAAAAAARFSLRLRWRWRRGQRGRYNGGELRGCDRAGVRRIGRRIPLIESTLEFLASDGCILISVGGREEARSHAAAAAAAPATLRLSRRLLGGSADGHCEHRTTAQGDRCRTAKIHNPSHRPPTASIIESRSFPIASSADRKLETGNWKLTSVRTHRQHIRAKCRPPFTTPTSMSRICQKSYALRAW